MAGHNFKKAGTIYVSKAGNDSSYPADTGQAVDTATLQAQAMQCVDKELNNFVPKATLTGGLVALRGGGTMIVGAGIYRESFSKQGDNVLIEGDGTVIFQGNGSNTIYTYFYYASITFKGIIIEGYEGIYTNSPAHYIYFVDCKIFSPFKGPHAGYVTFTNCQIINTNNLSITGANAEFKFLDCIIFNSSFVSVNILKNCCVNSASTISCRADVTTPNFDYNNIRGNIIMAQDGAVSASAVNGVGLTLAQHKTEYPTYNTRSFNLNPLYNDASKQDFTLQRLSPNINASSTGLSNIGGQGYAKSYYSALAPELQEANGAYWNNIILQGNDLVVAAGQTEGYIITAPMKFFDFETEVGVIKYLGLLSFNKSYAAGTPENINVPDATTYPNNQPGGNPDRLTFYMRWTKKNETPAWNKNDQNNAAHLAQWENQNYTVAGEFVAFEWNAKPFIDGNGQGNGSLTFQNTGSSPVALIHAQLKIHIRNNYVG